MTDDNNTLLDNEIPEKFRDENGGVKTDALMKSYKALERRFSDAPKPPKTPEEYCVDCAHGMFSPDADINARLHAKGLTEGQVQEVYDLAAEKLVPMIMDMADDFHADREVEKLINHYGGPEQWTEISRQLLAFGQKNMPADVLDNLSSSFEGVVALERMMKSGEPGLRRDRVKAISSMDESDLQSMMRDPKYWKDKDPAFVKKVTEGFQSVYGE